MTRRLDVWVPAAGGVLALALAAGVLIRPCADQPNLLLVGTLVHDFGIVPVGRDIASASHVFVLRNLSDEPVRIEKLSTTCGCTEASIDPDVVPPGGVLLVSATLQLANSGTRQADILLATDRPEQPVVRLTLRGTGRSAQQLTALPHHVALRPGESSSLVLLASDFESDRMPVDPEISIPAGVKVSFSGWKLISPRLPGTGQPARWEALLRLDAEAPGAEPGPRSVEVALPGIAPVSIGVELVGGQPPSTDALGSNVGRRAAGRP